MYSLIYTAFSKSIRFATRSWGPKAMRPWSPFLAVHQHRRTVVRAYKTDRGVFDGIRPDRNFDKGGWVRSISHTGAASISRTRHQRRQGTRRHLRAELVYVTFAQPPGKSAPTATSSGGVVKLRLSGGPVPVFNRRAAVDRRHRRKRCAYIERVSGTTTVCAAPQERRVGVARWRGSDRAVVRCSARSRETRRYAGTVSSRRCSLTPR
jgi:hypothetical protein